VNVYGRLLGDAYAGAFDSLVTDMELHYFDESKFLLSEDPQVKGDTYLQFKKEANNMCIVKKNMYSNYFFFNKLILPP